MLRTNCHHFRFCFSSISIDRRHFFIKWHFMKKFNHDLIPTPLERQESIEMIRALQHGFKVRMVRSSFLSKSVDTNSDRLEVEKIMKKDDIYKEYKK